MAWDQAGFQQILFARGSGCLGCAVSSPVRRSCPPEMPNPHFLDFSPTSSWCFVYFCISTFLLAAAVSKWNSAWVSGPCVWFLWFLPWQTPCPVCQGSCPGPRCWWQSPVQSWPCSELSSQWGCRAGAPRVDGDMGQGQLSPAQLKQQLWAGCEHKKPSPAFSWILSMSLTQSCIIPSCKLTCAASPQQFVPLCFAPRWVSNPNSAEEWLRWIWK